jgi:hypothetical protein
MPSADVAPALGNRIDQTLVSEYRQRSALGRARYLIGLGDLRFDDPAAEGDRP